MSGPQIVHGMSDAEYHARSELSSTGARRILQSPALFKWEQQHRVEKTAFDIGHAVHAKVLGTGMDIVVVEADSWRTKAARELRDAAYAEGKVPLLVADIEPIEAMTDAVLAHRTARALYEQPGAAEVSLFAEDPQSGVKLRARIDYLPAPSARRPVLVDLKTARSADPREFRRAVAEHGYHQQDPWYRDVLTLARGDEHPAFVFVVVEVGPPHLVSVCEIDSDALATGRLRNRAAIDLYRRCIEADDWPGYGDSVHSIDLPVWALNETGALL